MDFNEKLQQLRTKHGLTQEQLAEKVNVSRVAVSKWEAGRGYPNIDSLKIIAKVFDVTIDELLSTDELIFAAEEQSKNKSRIIRTFVFGITDFMAALLFVIPMFVNRFPDHIDIVTIQNLTQSPIYIRLTFSILIALCSVYGVIELALQNIQTKNKQKLELVLSGMFSSLGIVFSFMTNQPDSGMFFFALFLVKVLISIRTNI